jgi:hypothetical protein
MSIAIDGLPDDLIAALAENEITQDRWREIFCVRVVDEKGKAPEDQPNVLGRYDLRGGAAVFTPKYPISSRAFYGVYLHLSELGYDPFFPSTVLSVQLPDEQDPAHVARVYPTSDVLPANLLKFYIEFSQPMSRGAGFDYVTLRRSDGTIVEDPFPEIGVELWDAQQQRFTVLLDPGRIKRGLIINEEMGLPLMPGGAYRLEVSGAWPDAKGKPLAEGFTKSFTVVRPDHQSPVPDTWHVAAPKTDTQDPVVVAFPESLDAALVERLIWLLDGRGEEVAGHVTLGDNESRWIFTPSHPWTAGDYSLHVNPRLEDLAGNQLRRPFEIDVREDSSTDSDAEVNIPVSIR